MNLPLNSQQTTQAAFGWLFYWENEKNRKETLKITTTIFTLRAHALKGNAPVEPLQLQQHDSASTLPTATFVWDLDPSLSPRDQIAKLIAGMLAAPGCHAEMPVKHSFAKGMYIREMFIKKGALVAGKIHRQECINICAAGDISILTETGSMRVRAPFQIVSPAGMQRIGMAHEDTVWINIFLTDETDIDKLDRDLVFSDAEAIAMIDPEKKYFKTMEQLCQ